MFAPRLTCLSHRETLLGFLWDESTVPDGVSLCRHYKLIIIASDAWYIQCVKYAGLGRDGGTPVDVSGFTKAPSLFTVVPAVTRRINGLIKHAILPVMQSLSTSRRSERERRVASFVPRHIVSSRTCAFGRSCGRISPAPLLYARLHSILAPNRKERARRSRALKN